MAFSKGEQTSSEPSAAQTWAAGGGAGGEGGERGGGEKSISVGAVKLSTVTPRALCVRCGSVKSALTSVTSASA